MPFGRYFVITKLLNHPTFTLHKALLSDLKTFAKLSKILHLADNTDNYFSAMTNLMFGSHSDPYGHCCPPVFDPSTLVALLAGIALATFFLRLVIVTTIPGRSFRNFNILGIFYVKQSQNKHLLLQRS